MNLKLGILGIGAIAQRAYLPGFSPPNSMLASRAMRGHSHNGCPDCEIVALCDLDMDLANELANEYGVSTVYQDWHQLVEDERVDAICITTPNHLHAEMAIAAMSRAKHVLVEKPMATTAKDAAIMVEASLENELVLMVNHSFRFAPEIEVAKNILDSGVIGQPITCRAKFGYAGPEKWIGDKNTWHSQREFSGGGALMDVGVHVVDLAVALLELDPVEVIAKETTSQRDADVGENAALILEFPGGILGVIEASWTSRPGEISIVVNGSEGNLIIDLGEGSSYRGKNGAGPVHVQFPTPDTAYMNMDLPKGELQMPIYKPEIPDKSSLGGPFRHFVQSILDGSEPITSGRQSLQGMQAIYGALESMELGKAIDLRKDQNGN
jgi:predicted dehydrogenase